MTTPKVSVIIPSYNHRPYIGVLIDSIYAQTFKDFELIVVDDGSKDGSADFLQGLSDKFSFRLVLKENEGLCRTLNRGISLAQGEYILTIGSDDVMPDNRIAEQVEYLDRNPEVDVVGGSVYLIDESGKLCGKREPAIIGNISFKDMITTNRLFAPTAMIRGNVFKRFGTYPEDYLLEDYYLWLKILKEGGVIHNQPSFRVYYRISNQNLEKKFNWYFNGACQALKPYLSEPAVPKQMHRNTLIYCIKMGLLLGSSFKNKYGEQFTKLSPIEKIAALVISILPWKLRDLILVSLKLKT